MERRSFIKAGCLVCTGAIALSALEACSTLPMVKAKPVNGLLEVPLTSFATSKMVMVRSNTLDFDVLAIKEGDAYRALYMKCTHQDSPLAATDRGLYCSMHGSAYDLQGNVTKEPATTPLARFETTVNSLSLIINTNKTLQ